MKELIRKLQRADKSAFDEIYIRFHQKVYHFMWRYMQNKSDAQELTQLLFLRLWEKRKQLSEQKPLDRQIFVIARNLAIDELRKKARRKTILSTYQTKLTSSRNMTEEAVAFNDLAEQLDTAIKLLPQKRREIFRLSRIEGLSQKEIADQLSISVKTVESQMSKALKFIRLKLSSFLSLLL